MIDQLGNGLLLGIIISVASVALSLLYGVTRIVNFAHGEIIALGAIVTLFFSGPIDSRVLFHRGAGLVVPQLPIDRNHLQFELLIIDRLGLL